MVLWREMGLRGTVPVMLGRQGEVESSRRALGLVSICDISEAGAGWIRSCFTHRLSLGRLWVGVYGEVGG